MALIVETGTFNAPTGTDAAFDVTLSKFTGVTPKAVILYSINSTGAFPTATTTASFCIGAAVSASKRAFCAMESVDASAASSVYSFTTADKCFELISGGSAVIIADFVSFGTNKFTLNFSTVSGSAVKIMYQVIGGDSITGVDLVEALNPTATGNKTFTGMSFRPDCIYLMFGNHDDSTDGYNSSGTASQYFMLGAISNTGSEYSFASSIDTGNMFNTGNNRTWNSSSIGVVQHSSDSLKYKWTHVDWNSTGFTWNYTATSGTAKYYAHTLLLQGANVGITSSTTPTTANIDALTLGVEPESCWLLHTGHTTAAASYRIYYNYTLGFASKGTDSNEYSISLQNDQDDPSDTGRAHDDTICYHIEETTGANEAIGVINTTGESGAWGATGVTIDWTTVPGTADYYFVVGLATFTYVPTTWTVKQSGGDFATLNAAVTSASVKNGDIISIEGSWTVADTTLVAVPAGKEDLLIQCSGTAKHPGYWNESLNHYRLKVTTATSGNVFTATNSNITIDGLALSQTNNTNDECYCMRVNADTGKTATIKNCLITNPNAGLNQHGIHTGYNEGDAGTVVVENCIIYNCGGSGIISENGSGGTAPGPIALKINSCTIVNNGTNAATGTRRAAVAFHSTTITTSTIDIHNSICMGHPAADFSKITTYDATWNIDYSISSDTSLSTRDSGAVGSLESYTLTTSTTAGNVVIVNDLTVDAEDLRLKDHAENDAMDMHAVATAAGLTIPSTDIIGTTRPNQTNYDCGAFEVVQAGAVAMDLRQLLMGVGR